MRFQAIISQKHDYILIIFHKSKQHSSLSCHILSVTFKIQRLISRPKAMLKTIFGHIFAIFEDILLRIMPFYKWSHCPSHAYNRFVCVSYSFGAMPRSILSNNAIWDPNLKIRPATTLVEVKFQILDTYGVIVSSPKQFDIDRLKVKVIEMVLKVRPYLKKLRHYILLHFLVCRQLLYHISWYEKR